MHTKTKELLLEALVDIELRKEDFDLHSLRSGGVTLAANKREKDRLFKRHGTRKSENLKDEYFEDNLESLLVVTKTLGL